MLPVGITAPSPSTSAPSSSVVSPATSSRPGRLRGLSYLRHYTHGHHNHHSPASPAAAPTVLTTANASTAPQPQQHASTPPAPSPQSPPRQRRATSPLNNAASNSWIPTVSGVSGLSRVSSLPAAEVSTSSVHATSVSSGARPENDSASATIHQTISNDQGFTMVHSPNNNDGGEPAHQPASIRFTPHIDPRSNRESLHFAPIERTLRRNDERIRVGRYSDRDATNPDAPVGFKSKVVSRRHCEFWCDNGQWFVKDVKSSSGTFLNHIRLSGPGVESRPYPLNDGDVLQLGIDFKGGEEQIFRCVKIRVELNRAWQKALNNFNMSAHRRLRNLAKGYSKDSDSHSINTSECAICLLPVAPCQALFVAPCSHVWHYKCIRPVIEKEYPFFLCPNCRAIADLNRDIEEDEFGDELWEMLPDNVDDKADVQSQETTNNATAGTVGASQPTTAMNLITAADAVISGPTSSLTLRTTPPVSPLAPQQQETPPVPIAEAPLPPLPAERPETPPQQMSSWRRRRLDMNLPAPESRNEEEAGSSSGGETGHEGPMTPMNDAGPFVLDGGDSHQSRRETLFVPLAPEVVD